MKTAFVTYIFYWSLLLKLQMHVCLQCRYRKLMPVFCQISELEVAAVNRSSALKNSEGPSKGNLTSTRDENYDVAICLPPLYYYTQDKSLQMVEWFEMLRAMEASKVFIYAYDVHPNVRKVLKYYESRGMASLTYFHNPPPYVDTPILRK